MFWKKKEKISIEKLWSDHLQPLFDGAVNQAVAIGDKNGLDLDKGNLTLNTDILFFHLFGKVLGLFRINGLDDRAIMMLIFHANSIIQERFGDDEAIPMLESLRDMRAQKVPFYQRFEEGLSKDNICEIDFGSALAAPLFDINNLKDVSSQLALDLVEFHRSLFTILLGKCRWCSAHLEIVSGQSNKNE